MELIPVEMTTVGSVYHPIIITVSECFVAPL